MSSKTISGNAVARQMSHSLRFGYWILDPGSLIERSSGALEHSVAIASAMIVAFVGIAVRVGSLAQHRFETLSYCIHAALRRVAIARVNVIDLAVVAFVSVTNSGLTRISVELSVAHALDTGYWILDPSSSARQAPSNTTSTSPSS